MNLANLFKGSKDSKQFAAGSMIFEQGQVGDVMYVLIEGEVELRHGGKTVEIASPGSIFGEMALIDNSARSATAVAKTDCRVVPIDERRFEFLVSETPNFAVHVMRILVDRLRRTTDRATAS